MNKEIVAITSQVEAELFRATTNFGPFASSHEGYAVIKEELEELWSEIKKKSSERDRENMRKEAIQLAAMAIRFVLDICDANNTI